jgi:hypothetical protein
MVTEVAHLWFTAGLFFAPEPIRQVCTVWRLRDEHVKQAGRAVQHIFWTGRLR